MRGIPVSELRDIAGQDWPACQSDPELVEALAMAVSNRRMRERGEVPRIQPTQPDSATWLQNDMREGDNFLLDPLP